MNNLPRSAGIRKGYVDGPFGQMHYYRAGEGPALILCHQSPVCGRMFERAMPHLAAAGLNAIALDTPGFGNSDAPPAPPTIADYGDALGAFIAAMGLPSAHLLGHHTGGAIVTSLAARHPDRARSVILNGPPLLSAEDLEPFKDLKPQPDPIHEDGSHLIDGWQRRVKYSPGWTDEVAMHRRLVDQLWAGDRSWYGHHAAFAYEMEPDFQAISAPGLILTNTGDDIYYLAQKARTLRPDFAYTELDGGTHDIVDEQPEAWAAAVVAFLRDLDEPG